MSCNAFIWVSMILTPTGKRRRRVLKVCLAGLRTKLAQMDQITARRSNTVQPSSGSQLHRRRRPPQHESHPAANVILDPSIQDHFLVRRRRQRLDLAVSARRMRVVTGLAGAARAGQSAT
jgi:hypothetical protein